MAAAPAPADTKADTRPFDEDVSEGARAYAEALVNAASKEPGGDVDAVLAELVEFRDDVLEAHPAFAELLQSRNLPAEEKDAVLAKILEGRALPVVARFVRVLNRHDRLGILGLVLDEARVIWDRRQEPPQGSVSSAVPLDECQAPGRARPGPRPDGRGTPILQETVDPSLIGGLILQIGDDLYDMSVRRRLQLLRQRLVESKATEIRSRGGQFLA
ncbi:MAG: ATP synthase F1 subunit delta [Isosphaeraceae bacterium]